MSKSKLVLGTAQLGMKYGLNNTDGQPSHHESFGILDAALKGGIDTFDTANAYGTSEDMLGDWIKTRGHAGKIKVISKMKPHVINEYPDGTKAAEIVEQEIQKSLKRLHLQSLDGYLLHSPYYIYLSHVIEGLRRVKEKGLVNNIGVSIYDEDEALQAVELGLDYIQVPYNAFDQRLDKTDFFDLAKKNSVTVFARSPFLQGLLLMRPETLPPHLSHARRYLEVFIDIAQRNGLTQTEAALRFVDAQTRAGHIVIGVETTGQLQEVIDVLSRPISQADNAWIAEISDSFKDIEKGIVNPSLWSKIQK